MNIYSLLGGLAQMVTLLANVALLVMPVVVVMLLDRYRKDWRGWRYYVLAFAIAVLVNWGVLGTLYAIKGHH